MSRLESHRRVSIPLTQRYVPDYSKYGYCIERELGRNIAGGRVTFLATDLRTDEQVVIKQFQFAKPGSSWADYDAHQQEIDILRRLDHPGIPRYLGAILTPEGFCMVQDYKPAASLAEPRSFTAQDIQKIAVSTLNILVYLQNLIPSVIHGDIRPETILVDDEINVYLVDFGVAHIGTGDITGGSGIRGTLGFMPPEQLFQRQLTDASDLYSLGITLLCLATGTRSHDVDTLVDPNYRVNFKQVRAKLSSRWISWLKKMVAPNPADRFPNAAAALAAFPGNPILPSVAISQSQIQLVATQLNEQLIQTVQISNSIPNTLLGGMWEVAPHPSDPPHSSKVHPWIAIEPAEFDGNLTDCQITIDTSRLMADRPYTRKLLLHTNAQAKPYTITLQVQTAPIPIRLRQMPYGVLGLLLLSELALAWITASLVLWFFSGATLITAGFGSMMGAAIGFEIAAWMLATAGAETGAAASVVAGVAIGITAMELLTTVSIPVTGAISPLMRGALTGIVSSMMSGAAMGMVAEYVNERRFNRTFSLWMVLLSALTGISLGAGWAIGFAQTWAIVLILSTSIPFVALLVRFRLKQVKFITDYRKAERHLIKS